MSSKKEEEEIIREIDATDDDEVYRVLRPFHLIVRAGPAVVVPKGALVRLTRRSARELFPGGILPVAMTDESRYECIQPFRMVDPEGLWVNFRPGDIVELTVVEAIPLLKQWQIKPIKGGKKE